MFQAYLVKDTVGVKLHGRGRSHGHEGQESGDLVHGEGDVVEGEEERKMEHEGKSAAPNVHSPSVQISRDRKKRFQICKLTLHRESLQICLK